MRVAVEDEAGLVRSVTGSCGVLDVHRLFVYLVLDHGARTVVLVATRIYPFSNQTFVLCRFLSAWRQCVSFRYHRVQCRCVCNTCFITLELPPSPLVPSRRTNPVLGPSSLQSSP